MHGAIVEKAAPSAEHADAQFGLGETLRRNFHKRSGGPGGGWWILRGRGHDPDREVLTVRRWTEQGYLVALQATRGQVVRAEPFEAIELRVGLLFGEELEG